MKEADFYKKVRKDKVEEGNVEMIRCKSFLPEKKANFINNLLFPGATLRCARDCDGRKEQRAECNGYFYQCKKCGAVFGNIMVAMDCPMCKKKRNEEVPMDNKPGKEDKEDKKTDTP